MILIALEMSIVPIYSNKQIKHNNQIPFVRHWILVMTYYIRFPFNIKQGEQI